jgi:lipoteichoic acid synthase
MSDSSSDFSVRASRAAMVEAAPEFGTKSTNQSSPIRATQISILAMAAALFLDGIFIRATNCYYPIESYRDVFVIARRALYQSYADILTILCVTLLALLTLLLVRRSRSSQAVIGTLYFVFAGLMALFFCVNDRALEIIGGPITFQWAYYADLFNSVTGQSSVASNIDSPMLMLLALSLFTLTGGYAFLKLLLKKIHGKRVFLLIAGFSSLLAIGYLAFVHEHLKLHASEINYAQIENPLVEFIYTALVGDTNTLSNLPTNIPDADFRTGKSADSTTRSGYNETRRVRNVVLMVMESVGAKDVIGSDQFANGKPPVEMTPKLTAARAAGLTFNNFYAHAPMTSKSLFSTLTSRYPLFSFASEITKKSWTPPLTTLSGRLKEKGYRTGFFMSADSNFQQIGKFLAGSGFDVLSDKNNISCATPVYVGSTTAWPFLDSVDDECTAAALSDWIGDGKGAPFFGMMWTNNTHFPYFSRGEQVRFSDDPSRNRYLNALRSSDAAIGGLLEYLRRHDLANDTLVVVIGDHGESFGQHGAHVHGNNVFEEQVHIPLLLINPYLFRGGTDQVAGGLVDLAPTILDLLKVEAPRSWQGRSMFAAERSPRVYFMAPLSEMIAGYREGDSKFIFNAARNKMSVFDLKRDPDETRDLSEEMGEGKAREAKERLAAWVQYQERLFNQRTSSLP